MYGAGDVRVEDAADPTPTVGTDAVVRVLAAAVCAGDLHLYSSLPPAV